MAASVTEDEDFVRNEVEGCLITEESDYSITGLAIAAVDVFVEWTTHCSLEEAAFAAESTKLGNLLDAFGERVMDCC